VQVHKCDVCGVIGEPGVQWVRINISPFTIVSPINRFEEVPCYEEFSLDVCSVECARQRLIDFEFVTDTRKSTLKAYVSDERPSPTGLCTGVTAPVEPDFTDFPSRRMELEGG
jgi:hypothetical protein